MEGYEAMTQEKVKVVDPKKKILETVLPHFKTDGEGFAVFQGNFRERM